MGKFPIDKYMVNLTLIEIVVRYMYIKKRPFNQIYLNDCKNWISQKNSLKDLELDGP